MLRLAISLICTILLLFAPRGEIAVPRLDLLALTADDLASLTNRGTVKRAERELDAGEPSAAFAESPDGDVTVTWSDGIVCRFPAGGTVRTAECSSGTQGISRHVVRAVLAYGRAFAAGGNVGPASPALPGTSPSAADAVSISPDDSAQPAPAETPPVVPHLRPWCPGTFTDEALTTRFGTAAVAKAKARFEQGVLVELARGLKPTARFLDEPCTLRFAVEGDLRYVAADCAESLLPNFVAAAVWAFRTLPADKAAGLISLQPGELPVPTAPLAEFERLLEELGRDGLAGIPPAWPQRLVRCEGELRAAGLVWPAELAADLHRQHELYRTHDACFDPPEVGRLAGEALARVRAIRRGTKAVPQLLIRGTRSDRVTEISGGRLIGLGLGVRLGRRTTTLSAYLQDADSGSVTAVERTFADPAPTDPTPPRSFAELAATVLSRGIHLAGLGTSQLLLRTGKRSPGGQLLLPRTVGTLTANPQAFAWEQLKPPLACESFALLAARRASLPPSYLRPRRPTENLHVVAVAGIDAVGFDPASQHLTARLRDADGGTATLVHPFHSRGRAGFEALATALAERAEQVRFVCGHVGGGTGGPTIRAVSLILDDGTRRVAVQPWADGTGTTPVSAPLAAAGEMQDAPAAADPLAEHLERLRELAVEALTSGLRRASPATARDWRDLADEGARLGFVQLVVPIRRLAESLTEKANVIAWDALPAVRLLLELCLLARIAEESAG